MSLAGSSPGQTPLRQSGFSKLNPLRKPHWKEIPKNWNYPLVRKVPLSAAPWYEETLGQNRALVRSEGPRGPQQDPQLPLLAC